MTTRPAAFQPDEIQSTLRNVFGFSGFREGQREVIERILSGRSTLAVFPTGQGKSLCYQLPALHLHGLTLVVSPLLALMKDQVDSLTARNIPAARLDSSLALAESREIYSRLRGKELKLLYVAPERFANERFLAFLEKLDLSLLVIDEAHCISEWGHNFRPDYLKLAQIAKHLGNPPVLALTATATSKVTEDIRGAFAVQPEDHVHTGFYRPNLELHFSPGTDPLGALLARLAARPPGATVVYVTLQATAEEVARVLKENGYKARHYHAGMNDDERQRTQDWFMTTDNVIVVATIAFGMGIDKADIRYVYHYNLPKSLENYSQEIGRAGRDGKRSVCELLGGGQDLNTLQNFIYGDTPEKTALSRMVDDLLGSGDTFGLGIYQEAHAHDMRPLVVKTLLTYLELEGIIAATGHYYTSYRIRPRKSSAEILSRFDNKRAAFLTTLFSCARKAKTWFDIDLEEAVAKTGGDRRRVIAALNYLEEQNDLVLEASGAHEGFRLMERPDDEGKDALKMRLISRFNKREASDIEKVRQVVDLVNHGECKVRFLLRYFGEELPDACGHCGPCLGVAGAGRINPEPIGPPTIDSKLVAEMRKLIAENQQALSTPRQVARFLCGISSPRLTRSKLRHHPCFGLLGDHSFAGILEEATRLHEALYRENTHDVIPGECGETRRE